MMELLSYVYYGTWFVWPFVFVFGLAHGIRRVIETKKECNKALIVASVALMMILAGVIFA